MILRLAIAVLLTGFESITLHAKAYEVAAGIFIFTLVFCTDQICDTISKHRVTIGLNPDRPQVPNWFTEEKLGQMIDEHARDSIRRNKYRR